MKTSAKGAHNASSLDSRSVDAAAPLCVIEADVFEAFDGQDSGAVALAAQAWAVKFAVMLATAAVLISTLHGLGATGVVSSIAQDSETEESSVPQKAGVPMMFQT